MTSSFLNRARWLATLIGLVVMAGCASLPTAPEPSTADGGNSLGATNDPSKVILPPVEFGPPSDKVIGRRKVIGPQPGREFGPSRTALPAGYEPVASEPVSGSLGGEVENGRFKVMVPRGAFDGDATISMAVIDPEVLRVELHITGVENSFLKPVTLVIDWSGAFVSPAFDPGALEMVWFDEKNNQWVIISSTVDATNGTISAQLSHFSEYAVIDTGDFVEAKAGW